MARKIRWQVRFKTLSESDGRIDIYDEGWTGGITDLEPAESPITTEEDSDDDYLKPVRTQTGYLRVVDNGDLGGLIPEDNSQHYIELYIAGKLEWCGYMQADTFSEDWDVTPLIVEFPLISPLGLLDGVYLDQTKEMGVVTLAELLLECMESTGIDYERIYFPKEVWYSEEESAQAPFSVSLSRQAFFSDNGSDDRDEEDWQRYDADTCLSFVEEFCKFWGWSLHERQRTLYFIGKSQEYYVTTVENLKKLVYGGNFSCDNADAVSVSLSSLSLDGDDHKQEILQGVNKVKITAKIDAVGTVVPTIDEGYMGVIYNGTIQYATNGAVTGYKRVIAYESEDVNVQMKVYIAKYENASWVWKEAAYTFANMSYGIGAMYVKRDIYTPSDLKDKRNYNYKDGIWITVRSDQAVSRPTLEQARNMPILVMSSSNAAKYSNGAFVISGQTTGYDQGMFGPGESTTGNGYMEIKFRVGKKWWNGSSWGNDEVWFTIYAKDGKIMSTKTLDQPYNGADGYVMPISEDLSGTVELTMHAIVNDSSYYQLYIDSLKVDYYKDDNITPAGSSPKDENVYVSLLKRRASDEKELSLKIASNNNNQAAYNTLSGAGRDIGNLYFVQESASMLAEQHLLGILKQVYGRITEKLNITVVRSRLTPMLRLFSNGKEYRILSEKIEWADESEEIMIENIPD
jgi:hypothetical protein